MEELNDQFLAKRLIACLLAQPFKGISEIAAFVPVAASISSLAFDDEALLALGAMELVILGSSFFLFRELGLFFGVGCPPLDVLLGIEVEDACHFFSLFIQEAL